jgi:hypothetical protein
MERICYTPSPHYKWAAALALALGFLSAWIGRSWLPAFIPASLFLVSAVLLGFLATRPPIEIDREGLVIGRLRVSWTDLIRVDSTGYRAPLILRLVVRDEGKITLIYPGDLESSQDLFSNLKGLASAATIDGVPPAERLGARRSVKALPSPRYRVLRPEDEAEVERLYQHLKTHKTLDDK